MKKAIIILLSLTTLVFSWNLQEVLDSEGTQTNLVQCDNGAIKAVYYNNDSAKYEITPTIIFNTLNEASKYICKE